MEDYAKLNTIEQKLQWLQENGSHLTCKEVLNEHLVIVGLTETYGKPLTKTWAAIQALILKYEYPYYVSFKFDKNNDDIIDLILVSKFTLNLPCYSTKLFRCIAKVHNLTSDSELIFFSTIIDGDKKIIIKIENTNGVSLYNMHTTPI